MTENVDKNERHKKGPVWQKAFLRMMGRVGNVTKACEAAGVTRSLVYQRRNNDDDFRRAWGDAIETAADRLELEVLRRARRGTRRPVFHQGRICGHVREFSDTLAIFMLKAMRPEKFRDNHPQATPGAEQFLTSDPRLAMAKPPPGAIPSLPAEDADGAGEANASDDSG